MTDLTSQGRARKDQMLRELTQTMDRHHRARRARWRGVAATACIVLLGGLAVLIQQRGRPGPSGGPVPTGYVHDTDTNTVPTIAPDIRIVHNRSDVIARYTAMPSIDVEYLDDEALLRALKELDRPTGMIRRAGRVELSRPVTDALMTRPATDV
jgi:hypothetical protein